jgi:hypothetical protein
MYISGEIINNICDISIYKREYLNLYPGIKNYCKKIIYIEENFDTEDINYWKNILCSLSYK